MNKGPLLIAYNHDLTERVTGLDFGSVVPGNLNTQEQIVWLWNMKDFPDALTAARIRVSAVPANESSRELIDLKCLWVRSSGVMDPEGKGIIDDMEEAYSPIGGSLIDPECFHALGDIPANCARRLFFKTAVPIDMVMRGIPRIIIQAGYDVDLQAGA